MRSQVSLDHLEEPPTQRVPLHLPAEVEDRGLARNRLEPDPGEAASALHLVERLLRGGIAQGVEEPDRMHAKPCTERIGLPRLPVARPEGGDFRFGRCPGAQDIHPLEGHIPPRLALLVLESAKTFRTA